MSVNHLTQENSSPSLISPYLPSEELNLKKPIKLGIMASGSGSNFAAIMKAIQRGKLNAQVPVLIYNQPSAKAALRAAHFDIPALLLDHQKYSSREALDQAIVATFEQYQVEWVVMAGWMRVVTEVLINAFPDKLINIHPSLLPSFRGLKAVEQAIEAKVKVTGCTVHLVRLEVDSGPILIQAAVPVLPNDTSETLHARIQVQEHRILPQGIILAVTSS
ncbi:MAG: phosphoribosylglycinamide formyltransferase [Spirulinaceae cyanobacterium]